MIITLAGIKGGTGKTTVAAALAAEAERRGARTLLVDATRRHDLSAWAREGGFSGPVVNLHPDQDLEQLPALTDLALGAEFCVVDTATEDMRVAPRLASQSDLVLFPCAASPLDVWPLLGAFERFSARGLLDRRLRVLLSNFDPNSRLGRDVRRDLETHGIPLSAAEFPRRAVHAEALAYGSNVVAEAPRSTAAREVMALYDTLFDTRTERTWDEEAVVH